MLLPVHCPPSSQQLLWADNPQQTAQGGAATRPGGVAATRGLGGEHSSWTRNGGLQHPGCCRSWVWQLPAGNNGSVKPFAFLPSSPAASLLLLGRIFKEATVLPTQPCLRALLSLLPFTCTQSLLGLSVASDNVESKGWGQGRRAREVKKKRGSGLTPTAHLFIFLL